MMLRFVVLLSCFIVLSVEGYHCGCSGGRRGHGNGGTSTESGDTSSESGDTSTESGGTSSESGGISTESGVTSTECEGISTESGDTSTESGDTSTESAESGQPGTTVQPETQEQSRLIGPINCTRPNEHYECGSACQTECATLGQTCPIINIRCNDACYCNAGYARNRAGTCIPISQC